MNDKKTDAPNAAASDDTTPPAPEADNDSHPTATETAQDSGWGAGAEAVEEVLAALEVEKAELKDRLMRTMAEMENLRRRTEREVRDTAQYAIAKFAKDVVTVADNLERALGSVADEAREEADNALGALIEGVEVTERDLQNMFERHGISRIAPEGEKFDPNHHEAVFQAPDPNVPSGTVVQVMQPGYRIGERVLRPAMVGVSTGGPAKPAEAGAKTSLADDGQAAETGGTTGQPERPSEAPPEPGSTVDKTA